MIHTKLGNCFTVILCSLLADLNVAINPAMVAIIDAARTPIENMVVGQSFHSSG